MSTDAHRPGLAVALAGALLLSFDTLLLRGIDGQFLAVAFWRGALMGLVGLTIAVVLRGRENSAFSSLRSPQGYLVAACYGLASIFFVLAVAFTPVANVLVTIATAPLWAAFASYLLLKETIAARTWLAIGFGTVGVGLVVLPGLGTSNLAGDGFAVATALCMAGAFTISRRAHESLGLAPSLGGGMSALVLAPFVPSFGFETTNQILLMGLEGMVLMPLALGLIALAPRYLPAPQVGLFLLLETALGPLWVWAVLGEAPTPNAVAGGAIIVAALVAHTVHSLHAIKTASRLQTVLELP